MYSTQVKRGNMKVDILIFCIFGGYLFGSFSIARLVTRIMAPGRDLGAVELPDRNTNGTFQLKTVGATTASMILGPKIGGLIGILDILTGVIPTLALRLIFPEQSYFIFTGAAIVVGHIWPIYYRFRGGGGLSPALGTLLVLDPVGTLVSVILAMLIGMFILKEISFIVMGGPILFIIWIALRTGNWFYIIFSLFINLVLFIAVIPDVSVHLRARRAGKTDLSTSMDSIPMGQMMKKMMKKLGLSDKKTNQE
jgi:glycerol-3-phosphate acyltransferase PlsY